MRRCIAPALACLGLVIGGCGSDDSGDAGAPAKGDDAKKSVAIDVGNGKPIEVKTNKPRVAFFGAGTSNLYLKAYNEGVQEEAKRRGVDVTIFDSKFDAARQTEQVQNALQKGGFDAYLILALDGNVLCPILSKQAPAQGIPVVVSLTPICDRGLKPEGTDQWAPGTIAHVQNDSTYTEDQAWIDLVAKRLQGKHTVAVLNGFPLLTVSKAIEKAVDYGKEKYPNLDFKYMVNTDFTTQVGHAKTQTLLQAHPEIDVVLSVYSDVTVGAIKAIKGLDRSDSVKVFDIGGSKQSFDAVKAGQLEMTTYHTPHDNGVAGLKAVVDAFEGKKVPRYVGVYPPGASLGHPLAVDKENIDELTPQYG